MARVIVPKEVIKGTATGQCKNCNQQTELEFEIDKSKMPYTLKPFIDSKLIILSSKLNMSKGELLSKAIRHFEASLECPQCKKYALSS